MRMGKKATVVEAKKTRSCVVRLEKLDTPLMKSSRSGVSARGPSQTHSEEKKLKGPLKKRPITQTSALTPTPSVSRTPAVTKIKDNDKIKVVKSRKSMPAMTTIAHNIPTPTIAAGRSRRAIKPNPKYASEDMVTSKLIKNVANLGTPSNKKSASNKPRKRSVSSSSEDFFNKASSDDSDIIELDKGASKQFSMKNKETDSDFSEDKKPVEPVLRKPGRPRKYNIGAPHSTPVSASKTGSSTGILKHSSQFLQLRKSFAMNARAMESLAGVKRKHDVTGYSSSDNDLEPNSNRKRFMMSKPSNLREYKSLNSSDSQLTIRKNTQTLNGSKVMNTAMLSHTPQRNILEKRKVPEGISTSGAGVNKITGKPLSARLPTLSMKSPNIRMATASKQRSSSPASILKIPKTSEKSLKEDNTEKKASGSFPFAADDFEVMPTFTIVNINDIINKKGDVLISKSNKSPKSENVKAERESVDNGPKINENKYGRRKISLLEKADMDRSKSPIPSPKKNTQKIINHTLGKKLSTTNAGGKLSTISRPLDKPAPRILNSMVAKQTQPVKPLIANLEDSADDESYPLSMDDDDAESGDDEDETFAVGKRELSSSTPFIASKRVPPATKENSLAATNRMVPKHNQHKLTPERVEISRQGDKVIKKVTCYELWHVVNVPEDLPPKIIRNQLEIPLIQLANSATYIQLPSDSWMSKVSLHEISPTMLATSNFEIYTGDLTQYRIPEADRERYQPSTVMFRRSVSNRSMSRLPYDRAVIFKNKSFFTNIDGKNVRLVGAPSSINSEEEVEILLDIVDALTLDSPLVETTATVQ